MRGIRLFPIGLIVLSALMVNAQEMPAAGADTAAAVVTPPPVIVYPKRPAELPPQAPKVSCRGDQITISANNSTLQEILSAVKGCTGARIEIPEGASHIRSFEELGPGPVRKVLDDLLSGTPYNYVIQSSEANPLKVETVLMSMRGDDSGKPGTVAADDLPPTSGRRLWQHMQKFDKPDPSMVNDDGTLIDPDAAAKAQIEQALPVQPADAGAPQAAADAAPATPDASAAAAEPRAVAPVPPPIVNPTSSSDPSQAVQDRISQMQQMFNQRQQMIRQQNQNQSAPPNN